MKTVKAKRCMKDGREDRELIGSVEGATSSDEKPDAAWLDFGAELPGLDEDQLKRGFYRGTKRFKHKEVAARSSWHAMLLRFKCAIRLRQ